MHASGNGLPAEPGALAQTFWSMRGDCHVVAGGAAKVGVVTGTTDDRVARWAAYRYPYGTVVYLAQSCQAANGPSGLRPLTTLPLTVQQLAAQAVNPKFHLS